MNIKHKIGLLRCFISDNTGGKPKKLIKRDLAVLNILLAIIAAGVWYPFVMGLFNG